ncbi:MAG: ABC transporter ATP-binding protein [Spirochaetota bacterium]
MDYRYILEVEGLVKQYPEIRAVDDISFAIEPGICFGLLGPNGAGKTTSIEVIEGIVKPTEGTILYKGHSRTSTFHEEAGIQLQSTELPQFLTVKETLQMYRNLYRGKAHMDYLVETCRLEDILKRDNRKISGGQKQRLLLAIALANDPDLVFLDEPTTGLDPQARRHLWDIVTGIQKGGKTIILTTHYMEEAEILCDRIAIMDHGKIIAMDSPEALLNMHTTGTTIVLESDVEQSFLESMPCKWYRMQDHIEIQTEFPDQCVQQLMQQGVALSGMSVRSPNLEDLFLKLTGHELRA